MAWGDDDPALTKPKAPAAPKGAAWGDDDAAVTRPAAGKKKSQMLGVLETALNVADKVNDYSPANLIPGFREREQASRERLRARVAERQQTQKPGLLASTIAGLELTAPIALASRNPLVVGAGQGALLSEHRDAPGIVMDAATGAALNWGAGKIADKTIDVLAPQVSKAVSTLKGAGVRMTPGQIKGGAALAAEDKLMSVPIVGPRIAADRVQFVDDFNRGAVNRVLLPLGKRLPDDIATGHDAVDFMQKAAGSAYDDILPKLSVKLDQRLMVGVRSGWTTAQDLSEDGQRRFAQILANKLRFGEGGELSGRRLAVAARDLRDLASGFSKGSTEDERILGAALREVYDGLDSSLMAQNPGYAKALKAANAAYRGNLVVSRAAAMADDGVATTGQFKTASRAVDATKGKRATGAGRGPMQDYIKAGREVTGKTPDSGTAGRVMEGSWLAKGRGALEAAKYEADKAISGLRTAPRPAMVTQAADFLAKNRVGLRFVGGPVLGGLLAGIVSSE